MSSSMCEYFKALNFWYCSPINEINRWGEDESTCVFNTLAVCCSTVFKDWSRERFHSQSYSVVRRLYLFVCETENIQRRPDSALCPQDIENTLIRRNLCRHMKNLSAPCFDLNSNSNEEIKKCVHNVWMCFWSSSVKETAVVKGPKVKHVYMVKINSVKVNVKLVLTSK